MQSSTKIVITSFAALFIVVHMLKPSLTIDGITIALFLIAILPWIINLIKSLELPGGVKVEISEKELSVTEKKIENAGLISKTTQKVKNKILLPIYDDPVITLAALRIEIEKRLKTLLRNNDVPMQVGLKSTIFTLYNNKLLEPDEQSALLDLITVLNSAVHAEDVSENTVNWAIKIGPGILMSLDKKIKADT